MPRDLPLVAGLTQAAAGAALAIHAQATAALCILPASRMYLTDTGRRSPFGVSEAVVPLSTTLVQQGAPEPDDLHDDRLSAVECPVEAAKTTCRRDTTLTFCGSPCIACQPVRPAHAPQPRPFGTTGL